MTLFKTLSGYADAQKRLQCELPIARQRIKVAREDVGFWQCYADCVALESRAMDRGIGRLTLRLLTCGMSHRRALRVIRRLGL